MCVYFQCVLTSPPDDSDAEALVYLGFPKIGVPVNPRGARVFFFYESSE